MSADMAHIHGHRVRRLSDEDIYVAITRAWCRMLSLGEHRKYPLNPYALGPRFATSVADAPIDWALLASVCARVACRHMWQPVGGELLSLEHTPHKGLDPLVVWWFGVGEFDGLGVHYAELGSGTLEFLSVAQKDNRPGVVRTR
jgi:hypothetical protein